MVDTVDAVRFLDVAYRDRSLQFRDVPGFTPSMIRNACINRYYHLQRRSSIRGFATAGAVLSEFIEGSKLLRNGEEKLAFGVRRMKMGTISTWVAFTPIAKTPDDKNFIWCIFNPTRRDWVTILYKSAGTVGELLEEAQTNNDVEKLFSSPRNIRIGADHEVKGMVRCSTWLHRTQSLPKWNPRSNRI